jgi:alkanesulfonate monooxygenase SsuD/methylene tetrahydromethanopterin reductase-like flavin-dependent oxidoreductase (luciferase family)
MWEGDRGSEAAFDGSQYRAGRLLNSPQALSRPHPPIMIGGGGEKKTLRLVAQYADACNVFGGPAAIHHKYEVLREHCEAIGRDPGDIERSTLQTVKLSLDGGPGDSAAQVVDRFGELSDAGAQHVIFSVRDVADPRTIELLGRDVLPGLHALP